MTAGDVVYNTEIMAVGVVVKVGAMWTKVRVRTEAPFPPMRWWRNDEVIPVESLRRMFDL